MYMNKAQRSLDKARRKYRRAFNRGYSLAARGHYDKGHSILEKANAEMKAAEAAFALAREENAELFSILERRAGRRSQPA